MDPVILNYGANGTQKEHIEIAHAVADVIAKIFAEEYKGKELVMLNINVVDYFGPKSSKGLSVFLLLICYIRFVLTQTKKLTQLVGLIKEENDIQEGLKDSNVDKKLCI